VASALLREACALAKSRGFQKLTLTVMSTNPAALALYRRAGFVEEGCLKGEFLIDGQAVDDIFLSKWLAE
jgi:ribosomal protein S18 acetylase RimI-like enzyme